LVTKQAMENLINVSLSYALCVNFFFRWLFFLYIDYHD
jgi:hypothetical protein